MRGQLLFHAQPTIDLCAGNYCSMRGQLLFYARATIVLCAGNYCSMRGQLLFYARATNVLVRIVDINVVVILVGIFHDLAQHYLGMQLWVGFDSGL